MVNFVTDKLYWENINEKVVFHSASNSRAAFALFSLISYIKSVFILLWNQISCILSSLPRTRGIQMIAFIIIKIIPGNQKCLTLAFSFRSGAQFLQTIISFQSRQAQSFVLLLCSSHTTAPQPCFLNKILVSQRCIASFSQSGTSHGLTYNSGSSTSLDCSPIWLISISLPFAPFFASPSLSDN